MRHLGALIVLLIGGCNCSVETDPIACPAVQTGLPATPVAGAPHAGNIREVATTEAGDAAISLDEVGGIRVWPAMDGTREPIAISVQAPMQIAIAPVGSDLLAAVLDQAGSAHLLRVTRSGHVTGRFQAAGDVPIVQLVAERDGMLALRADQTVDRIDGSGVVREHLASDPGERIATLVARNGAAAAVLEDGKTVRWIEHGAWGARVTLPTSLRPDTIALAPGHRRLAGGDEMSGQLFVIDLSVQPGVVLGTAVLLAEHEHVGFIDDDNVAALSGGLRWWQAGATTDDPWAPTTPPNPSVTASSSGAVANGVAIVGSGASLALVTPTARRYLGWSDVGVRDAAFLGDHVASSAVEGRWLWLDDRLVSHGTFEVRAIAAPVHVLDEHHVVLEHAPPTNGSPALVELVDPAHPDDRVVLGRFANIQRFDIDPASRVLAVTEVTNRNPLAVTQPSVLHRWRIDGTVTPLRDVALRAEYTYFRLAGPDGAVAIGARPDEEGTRVEVMREDGTTAPVRVVFGAVMAIDDHGGIYARRGDTVVVYRDDGQTTLPLVENLMPSHGGDLVAAFGSTGLAMFDRDGHERWRLPVWNVYGVAFTPNDHELYVRALGGMIVIDAATGEQRAAACGWRFGITDHAPDTAPAGADSVCADNA